MRRSSNTDPADVPAPGSNSSPADDSQFEPPNGDGAAARVEPGSVTVEPTAEPTVGPNSSADDDGEPNGSGRAALAALVEEAQTPEFVSLLEYLHGARGFDFRGYKRASLVRRFRKRLQTLQIASYQEYRQYLEAHPDEFVHLFNTALINVTAFFRDPIAWETLTGTVVPALLERRPPHAPIRVWSAGCATGEEAYSLAMVFAEALGVDQFRARVKIYATDVDEDALQRARIATYTVRDLDGVPDALRTRYFETMDDRFVFRKDLRRSVIFGRNDLVQDAPISKIDLLVSRNTLMYFDTATQRNILSRFHFALNDGGYLLLGRAETLLTHATTFTPVDLKNRVFAKVARHNSPDRYMRLNDHPEGASDPREPSPQERLREGGFDTAPVAQVVVNRMGTVVAANARARWLFNLVASDIGRPLQDLELSYRPTELRSLVDQAYAERQPVVRTDIAWTSANGDTRWFTLHVVPVPDGPITIAGVTLSFMEISGVKRLQQDLEASNHELETAFEELQSTNEEMETTNEELQSTVEELETTNEELQSTNEELETMNEELQSTNEELQTINDELRQRSDELNEANAFLESVFASIGGAVAVLDERMHVLVWNERAEDMWGLRADEVRGSSFPGLDIGLPVDALKPSIRSVLLGATPSVTQTVDATNRRGRRIECTVAIDPLFSPAHDGERGVRGVILVMRDGPAETVAG